MSTPDAAVVARGVTVRRGPHLALDDVSATVPRGSITGLLGPSGCGKSTLMRAIVGTQSHVDGTLTVLGLPAGVRALRSRVGYVTQAASVYVDLTVRENIAYFARLQGNSSGVDDALAAVDLTGVARQRAANLSGGQLRRVSIASALVGAPELLILDEPTVGLDPVLRADLWQRFRRLADDGTTLLVSSHVMDEADHCDGLILLRDGRLVATTTADEMRVRTGCSSLDAAFLDLITHGGDAA
ncbi:ABC transporter ATP-binding protein [Gordonia sp. (in: high G+C Gram-positive bacteria)]|uniref:ABC transporter ATP-binding protein n=1 Tax=Gordonia sp. (in: high G+C Gram-positive bacteria) TaxID=84139 RepID=UPI0026033FC1|nr:ABC transporter ATP-binding protein [Gordonia sp. (in: high G+C Gram-positive bacteria)]